MFSYLNIALHASAHLVPLVHTSANYRFYFHLRLSIIPDKFTQNVGCVVSSSCLPSFLYNFMVVDERSFVKTKELPLQATISTLVLKKRPRIHTWTFPKVFRRK